MHHSPQSRPCVQEGVNPSSTAGRQAEDASCEPQPGGNQGGTTSEGAMPWWVGGEGGSGQVLVLPMSKLPPKLQDKMPGHRVADTWDTVSRAVSLGTI
jgi:hypothetical protein